MGSLIEEFARTLAACSEPLALQQLVVARLLELSGCGSVTFCALAGDGAYRPTCAAGAPHEISTPMQFAARGPLAKWLRVNEVPLVLAANQGVVGYLPTCERELLTESGVAVCVPLVSAHHLLGFLLLGAPAGHWHPDASVLALLGTCGRVAALACESVALHHAERERIQATSRAQQLAVAGQLAAAVAHEVRNPLTTIRSSVQYVMESSTEWSSSKVDLLREVISEVDRINRTVSGVLGLSRPEKMAFDDIDLIALVAQSLTLVQPYLVHHRLTLARQLGTEPVIVRADAAQLRQVLLNVLLNACQATPDGGHLSIGAGLIDDALATTVTITDSGAGIPPETLARIFDPFFTTKSNGTGLGLPISIDIMKRHGGTIRVTSDVGRGTTVVLSLPARTPAER